jgi:ADP-heptose:LPS heptosyltransferase
VHAYEKLKHRSGSLVANLVGRAALASRLRRENFDFVLVPSPSPQALRVAASVKAKRVLHADGQAGHEVERVFALGAQLGLTGAPGPTRVYPDAARIIELVKTLRPSRRLVAVHISARRPAQRWPIDRYAKLVAELGKTSDVMLLWAPGRAGDPRHPGDDDAAAAIPGAGHVVKVPTPDLATLIAALSLAERVICPDGGAMHLAAALGKPVVALFGDSPVERWHPWGVPHRVVRPASGNLADLGLDPVLEAFAALSQER